MKVMMGLKRGEGGIGLSTATYPTHLQPIYVKLLKFTCKKLDSIECCVLYKNGAETRLMSICNFKNFLGSGPGPPEKKREEMKVTVWREREGRKVEKGESRSG